MIMEDILYDETETIDFIYNGLNDEEKKVVNKDLIEDILDYILDFYEDMGFLEGDDDDEIAIPEEELFAYVQKKLIETGEAINDNLLQKILDLEYQSAEENEIF
jgi:hypothetical protein